MKQDTGDAVPGGCHDTRAEALKHMRALYANEGTSMKMSVLEFTDDPLVDTEDENIKWLRAWRYSTWNHPKYGTVEVTPEMGQDFKTHFENGSLGRDHLVNYDHGGDAAKGGKAGGVILGVDPREDGIWYQVNFTDTALQEIKAGEWRYLSPEYDDFYIDPETGDVYENMMFDLALTNTPFFKGQPPLNFSELKLDEENDPYEFSTLTAAQRNALPDSDFLYIDKSGNRHLPVHDLAHVRAAISRLSQPGTGTGKDSWLTESLRTELLAKARKKLASMGGKPKGGSEVDELTKKFASELGLTIEDDESEESILAKAKALNETIEPLRRSKEDGERARTFREAFPKEWERIQKLESAAIETEAKTFAESYSRFTIKDSDGSEYKSVYGFSELVKDKVASSHKKVMEREFSAKDLKDLLDLIGNKGIVDYSERGSSRTGEEREFSEDPKKAFSEAVEDVMKKDELDYEHAISVAAGKYPKLYEDYVRAIPQR